MLKHFIYDHRYDERFSSAKTLPEFICKVYGAEYDGNPPDYIATEPEIKTAEYYLAQFTKPVILVHAFGAIPSDTPQPHKVHNHKDMDVVTMHKLVEKYKDRYDFVQIGLVGEPPIEGCHDGLGMPMREAIATISLCHSFVFIESIFAHCSAALKKRGVVVFNNTDPKFFGYAHNVNIDAGCACPDWPCNRPQGALFDMEYGYRDPKTRIRPLWACRNQLCNKLPFETLESAFLKTVEIKTPAKTLAEARLA